MLPDHPLSPQARRAPAERVPSGERPRPPARPDPAAQPRRHRGPPDHLGGGRLSVVGAAAGLAASVAALARRRLGLPRAVVRANERETGVPDPTVVEPFETQLSTAGGGPET